MQIRLCSIAGTRWLEELPSSGPLPRLPRGLGSAFERAFAQRAKEYPESPLLKDSPLEGLVVALAGVVFQSADLVTSVAHAVASAKVLRGGGDQAEAYAIERFVKGDGEFGTVPKLLASVGVYSWMPQASALHLAGWCRTADEESFTSEVSDMHGAAAVRIYAAVLRDLTRTLESVATHGSDLCCINGAPGPANSPTSGRSSSARAADR